MNFKEIAAYSLGLFGFQAIVGLLNSYQAEFDASILGADIAVVGILSLLSAVPIFKYDIVGKKKQEISDALQARRTAAAAEK